MEDDQIIELFFRREESALWQMKRKYGTYLQSIVFQILRSSDDTEEILNDIYLSIWNAIPPARPHSLKHYLSRIARNLSFNRLDYLNAQCRNSHAQVVLAELEEIIRDDKRDGQRVWDAFVLGETLNHFLSTLDKTTCALFLSRYYYALTFKEIAKKYHTNERHVKYILEKTRAQCKEYLRKEGFYEEQTE